MKPWDLAWKQTLGLPDGSPVWLVAVLALMAVYLAVIIPSSVGLAVTRAAYARLQPKRRAP